MTKRRRRFLYTFGSILVLGLVAYLIHKTRPDPSLKLPITELSAPEEYGPLLERYVTADGVAYTKWSQSATDLTTLERVTEFYAGHRPPQDETAALAWHLNAYNAWILHHILKAWPNEGPFDVSLTFFHRRCLVVSGWKMSFVHLENKVIRPQFSEPRLHFALNCASRSCPPLHPKPFTAETLENTLEQLTKEFLNRNPHALTITGEAVQLSSIFDWYAEDFGGEEALVSYINPYRATKLPTDRPVDFLEYDWSLNGSKTASGKPQELEAVRPPKRVSNVLVLP